MSIDHGDTVEELVRYGRDIEKTVLSGNLRYHVKDRVLARGNKTIVVR
jgi:formyltetrahydrofolate deformylase